MRSAGDSGRQPPPRSPAIPPPRPRLVCVHCEDPLQAFGCGTCEQVVSGECRECHGEVRHGVLLPPVPRGDPGRGAR